MATARARPFVPQDVNASELLIALAASPLPVLVEFSAPSCAPCRIGAPIVRAAAARLAGKVLVLRLDVQRAPDAADTFRIAAVPTLALFRDGRVLSRQIGLLHLEPLLEWVRGELSKNPSMEEPHDAA